MKSKKYDMGEMEDYFQNWKTPEEAVAGINSVIVIMTQWFVKLCDKDANKWDMEECLEFLLTLRMSIEEIKEIKNE